LAIDTNGTTFPLMTPLRRLGFASALGVALCLPASALAQTAPAPKHEAASKKDDFSELVPGAAALEGRIIAPCCWTQTIDIHGSEIATELRHEIRQRLKAGESQEAIEKDLVLRYGDRILAVPPDNPLKSVGVLMSLLFGAAGIGAGALILRWRRRSDAERAEAEEAERRGKKKTKQGAKARDQLDDRIDAELDKL
jgi:cytochrome c-type biogenesis protein CcmH